MPSIADEIRPLLRWCPRARAGCNSFSGLASAGRWSLQQTEVNKWGSSLVWWAGENFGDLEILLHEFGHTYGMAHGTIPGGCDMHDQCDHTCTMGANGGQFIRCLNAPHNWQVGTVRENYSCSFR